MQRWYHFDTISAVIRPLHEREHYPRPLLERFRNWELRKPYLSFTVELGLLLLVLLTLGNSFILQLPEPIQWNRILSYFWQQDRSGVWELGLFSRGLGNTLLLSFEALLLTMVLGYSTALLRLSSIPSCRVLAYVYVEVIRNTPLLVQLYVAYFVFSPLFSLSSFTTALIALSLFEGAYTSEIIRGSILSIPRGQELAAKALGFSQLKTQLLITHPQAIYNTLPILANQGVSLIKDSALASAIGVFELTRSAQNIQEQTFLPFEPWLGVCLIYFILCFSLSLLIKHFEQRYHRT